MIVRWYVRWQCWEWKKMNNWARIDIHSFCRRWLRSVVWWWYNRYENSAIRRRVDKIQSAITVTSAVAAIAAASTILAISTAVIARFITTAMKRLRELVAQTYQRFCKK